MFFQFLLVAIILGSEQVPCVGDTQVSVHELPEIRTTIDDTGFKGTVFVYCIRDELYCAAHSERVDCRLIPESTFKILNSLIALEIGVVLDEGTVIPWDVVLISTP